MWTRTWWVRPVSRRHSTSAASRRIASRLPMGYGPLSAVTFDYRNLLAVGRRPRERGVDRAFGSLRNAGRRSRDSAARCCAPRIASRAPRARRRSWRRPAALTCPCRSGGRCPAGRRRQCPERLPPQWCSSALTSVPSGFPAAGWTTRPGRLVDDQQMLVLEDDPQRDVLRFVVSRRRLRDGEQESFAATDFQRRDRERRRRQGFQRSAADQGLQPLPRQGRDGIGKRTVQPPARMARLRARHR